MPDLITIDEARRRVLEAVRPLPAEAVPLEAVLGRVLAEEVGSTVDVPPFDNSAMDGYAVVAGPAAELEVVGESRAGRPATAAVEAGQGRADLHRCGAAQPAPTPWCRWSAPRAATGACACPTPRRAPTCAGPARTCAGGPAGAGGRHAPRARGGGRARLAGVDRGRLRRPAVGGAPADRRRAGGARARRWSRARSGARTSTPWPRWWSGRAACRRRRARSRQRRGHARGAGGGAGRRRRGVRLGRRVGGPARPREGRAGGAGRRGALLGRAAQARQAHLVRRCASACWYSGCPATPCRRS